MYCTPSESKIELNSSWAELETDLELFDQTLWIDSNLVWVMGRGLSLSWITLNFEEENIVTLILSTEILLKSVGDDLGWVRFRRNVGIKLEIPQYVELEMNLAWILSGFEERVALCYADLQLGLIQ